MNNTQKREREFSSGEKGDGMGLFFSPIIFTVSLTPPPSFFFQNGLGSHKTCVFFVYFLKISLSGRFFYAREQ